MLSCVCRKVYALFFCVQERERAAKSHKGPILVAMRPQKCSSPEAVARLAGEQQQQDEGEPQLEAVPLPLGSVRVSLGAYSTFEDCYALVSAACRAGCFRCSAVAAR